MQNGSIYYPLFKHMAEEHALHLVDSELQEIINVVRDMDNQTKLNKENQERIESIKKKQDECGDHEYVHTNAKWASANQMRCVHCGKTIN